MKKTKERRAEKRQHYHLPVWFAEDIEQDVSEGAMVDISNKGIAFICDAGENCPQLGQKLTTRFNLPNFKSQDKADTKTVTRTGCVCRIDNLDNNKCRVAVQFENQPPFWNVQPS